MGEPNVERVVVTVDDQHLAAIQSVAVALQAAGMRVDHVMPTGGVITGEIAPTEIGTLKAVPGVADVERDQGMRAI